MGDCSIEHDEVEFQTCLKLGSRYYCSSCGRYVGADPPPSMNLPRTWWRTVKGEYRFSGSC